MKPDKASITLCQDIGRSVPYTVFTERIFIWS